MCITLAVQVFAILLGAVLTPRDRPVTQTDAFSTPFVFVYAAIVARDALNYFILSDRPESLLLQFAPSLYSGITLAVGRLGLVPVYWRTDCGFRAVTGAACDALVPVDVGRQLTWLLSSPVLLYQLSTRSNRVARVPYAENIVMVACGIAADSTTSAVVFATATTISLLAWSKIIIFILDKYATDEQGLRTRSLTERNVVVLSWAAYPVVFILRTVGWIPDAAIEPLWHACDVFSKVLGSSAVNFEKLERSIAKLVKRSEMLDELIPPSIVDDIIEKLPHQFIIHDSAVIMFVDIVEYTSMVSESRTDDVVLMLSNIFERFDAISLARGVTKIETIGDAYMAICVGSTASSMVMTADDMIQAAKCVLRPVYRKKNGMVVPGPGDHLKVRIGIHIGEVYSGIISRLMPRYCYIGDTVNTASRMQSGGETMRIHISDALKMHLDCTAASEPDRPRFAYTFAGEKNHKGKGAMRSWFVKPDVVYETAQ